MEEILEQCPNLEEMHFTRVQRVNLNLPLDTNYRSFGSRLTQLIITACDLVTPHAPRIHPGFFAHLTALKRIYIDKIKKLELVPDEIVSSPALEMLMLRNCSDLSKLPDAIGYKRWNRPSPGSGFYFYGSTRNLDYIPLSFGFLFTQKPAPHANELYFPPLMTPRSSEYTVSNLPQHLRDSYFRAKSFARWLRDKGWSYTEDKTEAEARQQVLDFVRQERGGEGEPDAQRVRVGSSFVCVE